MNLAWHAFFGVDGSNMVYYHHCTEVLQGYLLFSSISGTKIDKAKLHAQRRESAGKYMERAFLGICRKH
jgi:hypothetical protein